MGMTECVVCSDERLRCKIVLQRDHSVLCENLFEMYQWCWRLLCAVATEQRCTNADRICTVPSNVLYL